MGTVEEEVLDPKFKDHNFYSDVGSLWWLAQISRPDIFLAVHRCSKFQNRPSNKLFRWIKTIFTYLSHTVNCGLVYKRSNSTTPDLSGYVDASFGSEEDRSSRVGWFFLFRGNLVSWTSETVERIMLSSTEAECRGLVQISKENVWHRQFHGELGLYPPNSPTILFEDNTASISLSNDPGLTHKKVKHYGLEWSYFKQRVEKKEVEIKYLRTTDQPADILTKPLPIKQFITLRDIVMGDFKLQNSSISKVNLVMILVSK